MADQLTRSSTSSLLKFVMGRSGELLDAVLLGTGAGTVIDMKLAPRLLAPPDSPLVENAMAPMLAALAVMLAIAAAYAALVSTVFVFRSFDVRIHLRRPVRFQMALAYHAYLLSAGGLVCLWTQIFLWRGQWRMWLFAAAAAFLGNGMAQMLRFSMVVFHGTPRPPESELYRPKPIEIGLFAVIILLDVVIALVKRTS